MHTKVREFLERWLRCRPGDLPWKELSDWSDEECQELAHITQAALEKMPQKVHVRPGGLATRRGRFERLDAELRFRLDDDEEGLRTMLTQALFSENGDAGLRLISLLYDSGDEIALGAMSRMLLDDPDCPDRAAIQAMVAKLNRTPAGWEDALDAFVANPSVQAWDDLMRFCPLEAQFQRAKNSLHTLKARGVDPNLLFILGSKDGLLSEAIGWAEEGLVDPETILAQEKTMHSDEMRGTLLGLAARTYFHHGDRFNTVRYLKEAVALSRTVRHTVKHIEDHADHELREMMRKAGLRGTGGSDQDDAPI